MVKFDGTKCTNVVRRLGTLSNNRFWGSPGSEHNGVRKLRNGRRLGEVSVGFDGTEYLRPVGQHGRRGSCNVGILKRCRHGFFVVVVLGAAGIQRQLHRHAPAAFLGGPRPASAASPPPTDGPARMSRRWGGNYGLLLLLLLPFHCPNGPRCGSAGTVRAGPLRFISCKIAGVMSRSLRIRGRPAAEMCDHTLSSCSR